MSIIFNDLNGLWQYRMIAAHAKVLGSTLVTHNIREFRRVKDLKVTDWLKNS